MPDLDGYRRRTVLWFAGAAAITAAAAVTARPVGTVTRTEPSATPPPTTTGGPIGHPLGDPFVVDPGPRLLEITVTRAYVLGPVPGTDESPRVFLVVAVRIGNGGDDPVRAPIERFRVLDDAGQSSQSETATGGYVDQHRYPDAPDDPSIAPGSVTERSLAFRVRPDRDYRLRITPEDPDGYVHVVDLPPVGRAGVP